MLDWTLSKIICSMFAIALIGFAAAFFATQQSAYDDAHLQRIADLIGEKVDEISNINGNTTLLITYNKSKTGVHLTRWIGGKSYELEFGVNLLVVRSYKGTTGTARFASKVHLWTPNILQFNTTHYDIIQQDRNAMYKVFKSGEDFVIETRYFCVDGEYQYHTFIYRV
jgi:hypothetical protein